MELSKEEYLKGWLALKPMPENDSQRKMQNRPKRPNSSTRLNLGISYLTIKEADCLYLVLTGVKMSEISVAFHIKQISVEIRIDEAKRRFGIKHRYEFIEMLKQSNFIKKYREKYKYHLGLKKT